MPVFKRNGKYYIDYRYRGKRIRELVGTSKRLADDALAARKADIARGRFQFKRRSRIAFSEFAEQYMDYSRTNKKSWDRDKTLLSNLVPFFGTRKLEDIDAFSIEQYKQQRAAQVRPATVNRELALLRFMLNMAVRWGKLDWNPAQGLKMLRVENQQDRYLSRQEEERLLAACTGHLRPMVITALHTGMRLGEILFLKWEQVDLVQRVITLLNPKNNRVRKIPINDTLLAVLTELKASSRSPYVFVYSRSRLPVACVRTAWLNTLRRSGIAHCRFHDLRHTFASRLVAAGVDLVVVKELLGHSTITMTVRYAHAAPESKKNAVALLDKMNAAKDGPWMDTKRISDKLAKYVTCYP